jgi:hypothetical protein
LRRLIKAAVVREPPENSHRDKTFPMVDQLQPSDYQGSSQKERKLNLPRMVVNEAEVKAGTFSSGRKKN